MEELNRTPENDAGEIWYGGSSTVAFNNAQNLRYLESEAFNEKAQKMFDESLKEDHVDYHPHGLRRSNFRNSPPRTITDHTPD